MSVIGTTIEKEVYFRNTLGQLADPTTVTASAKKPDGTNVVATAINHISTGRYDVLYLADLAGLWFYRIEGIGNDTEEVAEGSFCIQPSSVNA